VAADEIWLLDHADIMGGGQLFALRLARALRADGRRVVTVCPDDSELAQRLRSDGFETRHATFPAPVPGLAQARAARTLSRVLFEAPADAPLVGNTARTQAFSALVLVRRRARPPFVHLMHERDSVERRSARFVHARFGTLAVIGSAAARAYAERLPGTPVEALNNFLDPAGLDALVAGRAPRPASIAPVVGFLGRLIPEKGAAELVEELAAARGAWSQALLAGGRQDEAYAQRVEERAGDRVRLLGHVGDVPAFLAGIDVLVVPSTGNEAQPTVIVEALAAGRPVLVRDAVWSDDFAGLPVVAYSGAGDLAERLAALPSEPADPELLRSRFGPEQAVAAIDRAVSLARRS
jgi:glycosyltransferase involved in cell wall biosynthesis